MQDFINANTNHGLISTAHEDHVSVDLPMIDGQRTDLTMLRPTKSLDSAHRIPEQTSNSGAYVIVHKDRLCSMWNTAFKEHFLFKSGCNGDLCWDDDTSKRWGCAWKVALKCNSCSFTTLHFKLYDEAESGAPGPNPATINVGLQVGLMKQGMSNSGMREILTAANIASPSKSTMQRTANRIGEIITEENQEDLERQCKKLQDLNQSIGRPKTNPIPAEADATYNNQLFSGIGNTPFQAGTQATLLVAENLTKKKKIIAVGTYSKLCSCSIKYPTDAHKNHCTANLDADSSIGNEGEYLREAISNVNKAGIQIGDLTIDGDSSSRQTATSIQQPQGHTIVPKYCTRHLTRTLERKIRSTEFTDKMFPGRTKELRKAAHNRFTYDLGDRVNAEFDSAYKALNGSIDELNSKLPDVCEAIIDCYRGDCRLCEEHSYVCSPDHPWPRPYLDVNPEYLKRRLFINASREDLTKLRELISIRFSTAAVQKTSNNSTQNKCEASNRGIKKATPSQLTFKRNYHARVHAAVHGINNDPGTSIRKLCSAVGSPIPESSAAYKETERMDAESNYQKKRKASHEYVLTRRKSRLQRYRIYDKKSNIKAGYSKDGCLEDVLYIPPTQQKPHQKDHSYQTNKITVLKKL